MTTLSAPVTAPAASALELEERRAAHTYHPLPVVISRAEGSWVYDEGGRRYLDMLAAYSALNFGHRHPALVAAAQEQLGRVTLTSRAFSSDQLGPFCAELAALAGMDRVLLMNSGAEAVETAIKTARKWGYLRKGVTPGRAKIVVCEGNFHGRTTTIISFSTDDDARRDFGPYTPGFEVVPYGDAAALAAAVDDDTVAVLVEPIQGEAGVRIPPDGYLRAVRDVCDRAGVLFIADEIQSGLGRTGATFACDHEQVRPDMYLLGKALGGGILPVSAVAARPGVLDVFAPGEHGSTFGGNPLACAIGREVVRVLEGGDCQRRAAELGARAAATLRAADLPVTAVRARGLWFGIDLPAGGPTARYACERLLKRGVLAKDTHTRTIRLAPPLTIDEGDLRWGLDQVVATLRELPRG